MFIFYSANKLLSHFGVTRTFSICFVLGCHVWAENSKLVPVFGRCRCPVFTVVCRDARAPHNTLFYIINWLKHKPLLTAAIGAFLFDLKVCLKHKHIIALEFMCLVTKYQIIYIKDVIFLKLDQIASQTVIEKRKSTIFFLILC